MPQEDDLENILREVKDQYERDYGNRKNFTNQLCKTIKDIISASNINVYDISCRTKSPESFIEKIRRNGFKYHDPLRDITDTSGIRITTYYQDEASQISSLIEHKLTCYKELSTNKNDNLEYNVFDYLSIHKIISITEEMRCDKEWKYATDYKAEVQIRTLLQHAWASRSHELQYKRTIPYQYKRQLSRLAGVLELVDDEFQRIRDSIAAFDWENEPEEIEIKLESAATMKDFLESSKDIKELYVYAKSINYNIRNTFRENFLDDICRIFNKIGINSVRLADAYLSSKPNQLEMALDAWKEASGFSSYHFDTLFIFLILIISKDKINIEQESEGWDKVYSDYLTKAAKLIG